MAVRRTFASILLSASLLSASSVEIPAFFSFSDFLTHLNCTPRFASLNGLSVAVYMDSSATARASSASRSRRAAALASFLSFFS